MPRKLKLLDTSRTEMEAMSAVQQHLLVHDDEEDEVFRKKGDQSRRKRRVARIRLALLVILTLVASLSGGIAIGSQWRDTSLDKICLEHTSRDSLITPDVRVEWQTISFNGSLLKETVFRHDAGPEVDAAWESLGVDFRSIVVPAEQAERVGLRQDQVKISAKYGGGYPANIEGLHQLHCLNVLRQGLWFNFDHYQAQGRGPFANGDYILRKHVTHCLDIIRQQLMCSVDIGVMGQVWFQPASAEGPEAYVDFNTKHVCRNFEAVRDWAEKHQIPERVADDFLQPPEVGDRIFRAIP